MPETLTNKGDNADEISFASQRQLVWWRFRKHRLALVGAIVVFLIYLLAGIGGTTRISRANLLDELLHPFIATIGRLISARIDPRVRSGYA